MSKIDVKELFLPKKYIKNKAISYDSPKDCNYWDSSRISTAINFQYSVYQWADEIIKTEKFVHIADVGCGMAYKLNKLYQWNNNLMPSGFDQPNAIALCKEHYSYGEWIGVNLDDSPKAPDKKFELVISSDVIEHLENPDNLLDYIKDIVSPYGFILISTPERDLLRGRGCMQSPNKAHVQEWNQDEFSQFLKAKGFRIIEKRILQAIRPSFSFSYIRRQLKRILKFRTMRYSQTYLLKKI